MPPRGTPKTFFLFTLPFFLALSPVYGLQRASHYPYRGAIVEDADEGQTLFERNADEISPPASMTKLMTFAVIYDKLHEGRLKLTSPVAVDASDEAQGGSSVYLKEGECFPVEELIYAMMIQSANDAAHALSRKAGGSTAEFVKLMNAKARAIGMSHTVFRSPNGLPPASRKIADGDLTTPRDYALLCRYLLKSTNVLKYTSVKERTFGAGRRKPGKAVVMKNHNHLLGKILGVDGFKTGYTKGAGYCLATTAVRGNRRIIVVTMGSPNWKIRDKEIAMLIELGFRKEIAMARAAAAPSAKAIQTPAPALTLKPAAMGK